MPYDPARLLISVHQSKTAGTSFAATLRQWFGPRFHPHYFTRPDTMPTRYDFSDGGADACVHGHFEARRNTRVEDYYPQADQFIAFFREPFAHRVSMWRYLKQGYAPGSAGIDMEDNPDFGTYLQRKVARRRAGELSFIQNLPGFPGTASVIHTLQTRFVGVGIVEDYDRSVDLLASLLGKPRMAPAKLNVTAANTGDQAAWRALHRREFPEEYEVYEAALARYRDLQEAARG